MRTIELMALAMVAAACDGELMAGLPKQTVNIPITGGLDTKTGPLAVTPGSFLQLDDVRQERLHEWRNRQGITHADALDDIPGTSTPQPPIFTAALPSGGMFGLSQLELVAGASDKSAALVYDRTTPTGSARWKRKSPYYDAPMAPPGIWGRTGVSSEALSVGPTTVAVGTTGMRLVAWDMETDGITSDGIRYMLMTASGTPLLGPTTISPTTTFLPRAVYAGGFFLLFYCDSADSNLYVIKLSEATASFVTSATLKNNMDLTGVRAMDALTYPTSASVTVVYRQAAGNARQLEVNVTTLGLPIDVDLGVNCFNALGLLNDPDASGTRLIGVCTTAPEVRVLRTSTLGAILTNEVASTDNVNQIIGQAYEAGVGWQIVTRLNSGGTGIRATKKRGGVVGAVTTLIGTNSDYYLDANAWREPGTDTMRYVMGLHRNTGLDYQQTYYEMAVEFDTGGTTVLGAYRTPQSIIMPQNAAPTLNTYQPAQAVRTGAQAFALALPRVSNSKRASGAAVNLYAVDVWSVTYATLGMLAARPNIGAGATGSQCAYIPAGVLVQSCTGQRIEGHGGTTLPIPPTLTPAAGAGLSADKVYNYLISVDYPDDVGNLWRGPLSLASAITPTGGDLQVTVTASLPPLDAPTRRRILNVWRSFGNGAIRDASGEYVVQLVKQISIDGSVTSVGFTDATSDVTLATSNFPAPGLPTALTPAFNHVAFFDGRMWGAERDFPNRLRFTRIIQPGSSPEFTNEFFRDIEDEEGPITGIAALDDKLIVFKNTAVYFIPAGGPANDGSGGGYSPIKVSSEAGAESGTPYVSTGSHVWFFHGRPQRIDRSLHIEDIGLPLAKFFIMPILATPQVPLSYTYNHARYELRLHTTLYRFVYDTITEKWIRDTGNPFSATAEVARLPDVGDMYFRANGQVWWDYDVDSGTRTTDAGGDQIRGVVRSPWFRPAGVEGFIRLYQARALWLRDPDPEAVVTVWPTTTVYLNDDDTLTWTDTPTATGTDNPKQVTEIKKAKAKLTSFSIAMQLPAGSLAWRLSQWSALIAIKKALYAQHGARAS